MWPSPEAPRATREALARGHECDLAAEHVVDGNMHGAASGPGTAPSPRHGRGSGRRRARAPLTPLWLHRDWPTRAHKRDAVENARGNGRDAVSPTGIVV